MSYEEIEKIVDIYADIPYLGIHTEVHSGLCTKAGLVIYLAIFGQSG